MQIYKLVLWSLGIIVVGITVAITCEIVHAVLDLRLPAPNVFGATGATARPTIEYSSLSHIRPGGAASQSGLSATWMRSENATGDSRRMFHVEQDGRCCGSWSTKRTARFITTFAVPIRCTIASLRSGGITSSHQIMMRTFALAPKSKVCATKNEKSRF